MITSTAGRFGGIHAATVVPMRDNFSIDEETLANHLTTTTRVAGISGLLVNGHAGENFALNREEKRLVTEIARSVAQQSCLIVSGINAESSLEAAEHARDAEAAGADALLIFPPNSWAQHLDTEMAIAHHRHVRQATDLPLYLYQAPVTSGPMAYTPATIEALISIDTVVGIKEGSWEVAAYEEHRRLVKARRPEIAVLSSGDEHLLTCYLIGSEGSEVSLAAVVPKLVVDLWAAAQAGDWQGARLVHDQLYPLITAIYRTRPSTRATARLKACLAILGEIPCAAVRPPNAAIGKEEMTVLERALTAACA